MVEALRLKFQWNQATPDLEMGDLLEKFKEIKSYQQRKTSLQLNQKQFLTFGNRHFVEKRPCLKQRGFFERRNYFEKIMWKKRRYFDLRNYVKKSTQKKRGYFQQLNYIKQIQGNDVKNQETYGAYIKRSHGRHVKKEST